MLTIYIRPGIPEDIPFLMEMLFEAAYWRPNQTRPTLEEGLTRPDLDYLLTDWGRAGDTAVVAVTSDGQQVGAAWYRFWGPLLHSYGYISPQIPELAIAVRAAYRGRGIGHKLLDEILVMAASQGIEKISLSVEIENPALNLYLQHGFEPFRQNEADWVMVARTKNCGDKKLRSN